MEEGMEILMNLIKLKKTEEFPK